MHTISHHFLRRRARARALKLNVDFTARSPTSTGYGPYRVEKALRGPYRWRVVR